MRGERGGGGRDKEKERSQKKREREANLFHLESASKAHSL